MVALLAVVLGLLVVGLLEEALGAAGQRLLARAVSRAAGNRRPEVRAFLARTGDLSARLWGFRRRLYREPGFRFGVRSRAFRNADSNRAASAEPTTSESTVAELQSAPVIRSR